jgi:tetratricopeptide (TPR) repeat protein
VLMKTFAIPALIGLAVILTPIRLVAEDGTPEKFEPYLREHPNDELQRESALIWYTRRVHNFERLREHTLAMIDHHPSNMHIFFANVIEFLARPSYHAEVLHRLEDRVKTKPSAEAYWVLALTCQHRAIPPDLSTEAKKRRFLSYYRLESDASLPKHVDQELVDKTIRYFQKAIDLATEGESQHVKSPELAENDHWHQNFYTRQLVDFDSKLNRHGDALELCKTLARRKENLSDAQFLLTYGESLYAAGQHDEAKKWLAQVRPNDHEGFGKGPACATVAAETTLGLIALKRGDVGVAVQHLDASTKVQKCCHNSCGGFPTSLATQILDQGNPDPVVRYCETVLRDFTPDRDYFQALLERAKTAERKKAAR